MRKEHAPNPSVARSQRNGQVYQNLIEQKLYEATREERLHGRTYHNDELKLDVQGLPLNYEFFEPEDISHITFRGEDAWIIGIRFSVCDGDIDSYILAIDQDIYTFSKERVRQGQKPARGKKNYY